MITYMYMYIVTVHVSHTLHAAHSLLYSIIKHSHKEHKNLIYWLIKDRDRERQTERERGRTERVQREYRDRQRERGREGGKEGGRERYVSSAYLCSNPCTLLDSCALLADSASAR